MINSGNYQAFGLAAGQKPTTGNGGKTGSNEYMRDPEQKKCGRCGKKFVAREPHINQNHCNDCLQCVPVR